MEEFVEGWVLYDAVLGEGAYGEVKLIINQRTNEKVACKIIDRQKYKDAATSINKEVVIHRMMDHRNIIKFYGRRNECLKEYIFLEYACGGELFQQIEPDRGMPLKDAHSYFRQLLEGLKYIHSRGVAHRDIKPENLLIADNNVLKIIDFGMATVFRIKGKERLLKKRCGTKPYIAPEVLEEEACYKAEPADVWSCGIVLVAMLTGELPWSEPSHQDPEFVDYKNNSYISVTPWSKLGNTVLSLLKNILSVTSSKRATIDKIFQHPWMKFRFEHDENIDVTNGISERPAKRLASMAELETRRSSETINVPLSQPLPTTRLSSICDLINKAKPANEQVCFSQPVCNDDLIISSQIQLTQTPINMKNFDTIIKRMTRFYVKTSYNETIKLLSNVLDKCSFTWTTDPSGVLTINTIDEMKNPLSFKMNLIQMEDNLLVEFRLSKGCGLDFKKKFLKIRQEMKKYIIN